MSWLDAVVRLARRAGHRFEVDAPRSVAGAAVVHVQMFQEQGGSAAVALRGDVGVRGIRGGHEDGRFHAVSYLILLKMTPTYFALRAGGVGVEAQV